MGATELLARILADARSRAQVVEAEGKAVAEAVRGRAAAEASALTADWHARRERDAAVIRERARSQARLEERMMLLAARWRVIDRVLAAAAEAVVRDREYGATLAQLASREARPGSTAHLSVEDTKQYGKLVGARLGGPAPIKGGMVVRSGKEELDLSLDSALASVRAEMATELDRLLFPRSQVRAGPGPD